MRPLRIAAADDERDMREYYQELLPRLGHHVIVAETGKQLLAQCRALTPDLVITDIKMPDMDGLAALTEINRERQLPSILVSAHHNAGLLTRARQEQVMAYLIKPIKQADLEVAIELAMMRFEQFQELRKEANELRQALEDRKFIERAKGAVMRRLDVGEDDAFRRLRKYASDHNLKMPEVSRRILEAEDIFRALDAIGG